jgi:hypothetical protein
MATAAIPVVQRMWIAKYTGANRDEFLALIDPNTQGGPVHSVSETNGILRFSTGGYGTYTIAANRWMQFLASGPGVGYPSGGGQDSNGMTDAEVLVLYNVMTPDALPS